MTDQKVRRKRPVHVERRPDGRWAVVREGNKKASAVHPTREQAVKHARSMASKSGSEVYVHDREGAVREHDSYGAAAETHEEALGREVASVLLTRPDTGAVERQIAYRDEEETFIGRRVDCGVLMLDLVEALGKREEDALQALQGAAQGLLQRTKDTRLVECIVRTSRELPRWLCS
jgi:hypothetical protein